MGSMISTEFFQCDLCHVECRIDSEAAESKTEPLIVRHCTDSKGIAVLGKVTRFEERRGGGSGRVWISTASLSISAVASWFSEHRQRQTSA